MNPTTRSNLADVLDSCLFIQTTCATRTFDDYQKDRMFRRAIEREFEIVGESLKRVRDDEETVFDSIASCTGGVSRQTDKSGSSGPVATDARSEVTDALMGTHAYSFAHDPIGD